MKKIIVDRKLIRSNLAEIRSRAGSARLIVDLSGDGMGLGLVRMARLLMEEGIADFAVADSRDALTLRRVGISDARILVLRSVTELSELRELMESAVIFTLGSNEAAIALNGLAGEMHVVAEACVRLDTGLGQYGFQPAETEAIANLYRHMSGIAIAGIYTRIPERKSNKAYQLCYQSFVDAIQALQNQGIQPGMLMPLDASGLLRCDFSEQSALLLSEQSAVLVGAELLGYGKGNGKPVAAVEASLDELKWLDKGAGVGSKGKALKKPTRVAVIELGSYNGVGADIAGKDFSFRLLLHRPGPDFRIKGKRVSVLGDIGLYTLALDVTKNTDVKAGDTVQLRLDPRLVRGLPVEVIE